MGTGLNGIIFAESNSGFHVTVYLQVEYLKNGVFRDKVTKEH